MKFKKKKNASYNELLSVYMPSLWFFSLFLSLWKRINAYIFRSHSLASFSVCILSPGFRARWISWRVSASFQLNGLFLFHILCVRFRLALVVWCVCVCGTESINRMYYINICAWSSARDRLFQWIFVFLVCVFGHICIPRQIFQMFADKEKSNPVFNDHFQ